MNKPNEIHKQLRAEIDPYKPNHQYMGPQRHGLPSGTREDFRNDIEMLKKEDARREQPFFSPELTLEQVNTSFGQLRHEMQIGGAHPHRHATITERDPETGEYVDILLQLRPVPIEIVVHFNATWGYIREALDQAVHAAGVCCGLSKNKLRSLYFPFAGDAAKFPDEVAEKTKGLDPKIVAVLLKSKAYQGGNDPLWAVNRVSNKKKHASLSVASVNTGHVTSYAASGGVEIESTQGHSNKYELEYMRYSAASEGHLDTSTLFVHDIVVDDIEAIKMRPIIRMTDNLISDVTAICREVEDVCYSLGHVGEKLL